MTVFEFKIQNSKLKMKKEINFELILQVHTNIFICEEQRKIFVDRKGHSYTGHPHFKPLAVFYGV